MFLSAAILSIRIASCSLASDETLLDLAVKSGRPEELVAVSTLADDPRYSNVAGTLPKTLTGRCGAELESLLKLKPDLAILASYNKPELLQRLAATGVKTLTLGDFKSLDDIEANVLTVGKAAGFAAEALRAATDFHVARR